MKKLFTLLVVLVCFFSHQTVHGVAILTFSAVPVAKGTSDWVDRFVYVKASDDPSLSDLDFELKGNVQVFFYGVTSKLYVAGIFPYFDKRLEFTVPEGRFQRGDSGLADTTYIASYEILRRDYPGKTFRGRVYAGFEAPTGDDDESDRFGVLPQPLQLGSGSWDGVFSNYYSLQAIRWEISQEFVYKINTEANDFEFGDVFSHNSALSWMIYPVSLNRFDEMIYDVMFVLELNGVWSDRSESLGAEIADSGGYSLFISPGLQLRTNEIFVEAIVQLPIIQDLNGTQLETDYIVTAGFRIAF